MRPGRTARRGRIPGVFDPAEDPLKKRPAQPLPGMRRPQRDFCSLVIPPQRP